MKVLRLIVALTAATSIAATSVQAKDKTTVYPLAIFPFQERDGDVGGTGSKVTDLLFANLADSAKIHLVERQEFEKVLAEQEINRSGLVDPKKTTRIGHLTGAKLLVTGSVLQIDTNLHLVAKIIGTETSRVFGVAVKGDVRDDLDVLVKQLAEKIAATATKRGDELVANQEDRQGRLAAMKKIARKGNTQSVYLDISEDHVGTAIHDPAASTEFARICCELGWKVIDSQTGSQQDADILVVGKGVSEFACRQGNLITMKARLDLKAIDAKEGQVLLADRQVSIAIDLSEQLAARAALEEATTELAVRIIPILARNRNADSKAHKQCRSLEFVRST